MYARVPSGPPTAKRFSLGPMTIQSGSQTKHPVGRIERNIEIMLMYVGHLITFSSCTAQPCEFPVLLAATQGL